MKKLIYQIALITTITLPVSNLMAQEKEAFKPSGKVWGYAFGDYYFKAHADSAKRGNAQYSNMANNTNSLEFRRVYLGYDYNISEKFSTEMLLSYEGSSFSSDASRSVFIKSANVRWKNIIRGTDLVAGLHSTPAFPLLQEKLWAYRSVEKLMIDMRKIAGSTDMGVSLQGRLDSAGNFGYNLMVGNGTATKVESDRFKKVYGDVYAKFMNKKLIVDLYSDYEWIQMNPIVKNKMSLKLFVAYQTEKITVGVEGVKQIQHNYTAFNINGSNYIGAAAPMGFGGFVRGTIMKDKLGFFVRADSYDPDSNYDPDNTYTSTGYSAYNNELFAVAGLDYSPHKNVHIIPNIWYNGYQSRVKNAAGKLKSDYDLVPRLTFHYIFK